MDRCPFCRECIEADVEKIAAHLVLHEDVFQPITIGWALTGTFSQGKPVRDNKIGLVGCPCGEILTIEGVADHLMRNGFKSVTDITAHIVLGQEKDKWWFSHADDPYVFEPGFLIKEIF
jgi:hypothetical protein